MAVEGPGLRELKAQDRGSDAKKLRLDTVKRAFERLLVRVQPSCSRRCQCFVDASAMGRPPRTGTAVEQSQPEPGRQAVCAAEGGPEEVTKTFGGVQKMVSASQTIGHGAIYTVGV